MIEAFSIYASAAEDVLSDNRGLIPVVESPFLVAGWPLALDVMELGR
jgi:hypothetical protein